MEYLYFFVNASVAIWVIEYLIKRCDFPLDYVTVVHFTEGWLIRIKFDGLLKPDLKADFIAVMDEFGDPCAVSMPMAAALKSLEEGQTPTEVMQRYRIQIVAHGKPHREDIEAFRQQCIEGSGSCPESLK